MGFPARYPVQWRAYQSDSFDDYGNAVEAWGDPETVLIIGVKYGGSSDESPNDGVNRMVTNLQLLVPMSLARKVGPKDRFLLPRRDPDVEYQVEGENQDAQFNPFGWRPGGTISVRRVEG